MFVKHIPNMANPSSSADQAPDLQWAFRLWTYAIVYTVPVCMRISLSNLWVWLMPYHMVDDTNNNASLDKLFFSGGHF